MSDNPPGWAQLVAAPLGPEPPEDIPLGALPCVYPLLRPLENPASAGAQDAAP